MGAVSHVTVLWALVAGATALLSAVHFWFWIANRQARAHLVFAFTAMAFVGVVYTELWQMHASTAQEWAEVAKWTHLPVYFLFLGIVAFVHLYFGTGRAWLGWSVIGLRSAIFAITFVSGKSFNFERIDSIERLRFLGQTVTVVGDAVASRWQVLAIASCVLLLAYVLDASVTLWRRGGTEERRRAIVIGGSIFVFFAVAAGYGQLVVFGVMTMPLLHAPTFLAPLAAMTYELSRDLLRASLLAGEVTRGKVRLELAATAADLGLGEWDSESGHIWATSKARQLFGFGETEQPALQRWLDRIHPDDRARVTEGLARSVRDNEDYVAEFRVSHEGRGTRWLTARGRVSAMGPGKGSVLRGVVRDVTEYRKEHDETLELRRELAHTGRVSMLGQLASSLAHELSQPLGAILRNTEAAELMLRASTVDREALQELVADIQRDDRRAGLVIERLRSLLKRRELDLQPLAVDGIVQDVLTLVHSDSAARHIHIDCRLDPSLPAVQGDRVHLSQVLLNLLLNAMDAVADLTPDRRRVVVGAGKNGDGTIELYVADAGIGVPPDAVAQVFEPFFTTKPAGMGMGLAISRSIVESHGGRISVSNEPGQGARFSVVLPTDMEAA